MLKQLTIIMHLFNNYHTRLHLVSQKTIGLDNKYATHLFNMFHLSRTTKSEHQVGDSIYPNNHV